MALQAESLHDGTLLAGEMEGLKVNQDYGDTVPSKPINIGQTSKNEASKVAGSEKWQTSQNPELAGGDFGTVVVHGGNETDKPFTQISPSIKEHSSSFEGATGVSTHGGVRESRDSRGDAASGMSDKSVHASSTVNQEFLTSTLTQPKLKEKDAASGMIMSLEANKVKIVGWWLPKRCKNFLLGMHKQERGGVKMSRWPFLQVFTKDSPPAPH